VSNGNQCVWPKGHPADHRDGLSETWTDMTARFLGRCTSMNLSDPCVKEQGHKGNHTYGGREWSSTGGTV
jgi:hypothetical protein